MRKLSVIFFLLLTAAATWAQNLTLCPEWRISEVHQLHLPLFADKQSVDGKKFDHAALLESVRADAAGTAQWQVISPGTDSLISLISGKNQLLLLAGFVKSDRWSKASINISTDAIFELYLVDPYKVAILLITNDIS